MRRPRLPLPKPAAEKITVAADALFDFDKATLRPEGKAKLDELVSKAAAIKLEVILVVGHTDRIGSDAYNQKLSERRAAAVKTYLVAKGIEANRVYTEGKGEKQPVTGDKCKWPKAADQGAHRVPAAGSPRRHRNHRHQVIRRNTPKTPLLRGVFLWLPP